MNFKRNILWILKFFMKNIFVIFKYCPISNYKVNPIVANINNVESSSDSSNEVYNININNNKSNII